MTPSKKEVFRKLHTCVWRALSYRSWRHHAGTISVILNTWSFVLMAKGASCLSSSNRYSSVKKRVMTNTTNITVHYILVMRARIVGSHESVSIVMTIVDKGEMHSATTGRHRAPPRGTRSIDERRHGKNCLADFPGVTHVPSSQTATSSRCSKCAYEHVCAEPDTLMLDSARLLQDCVVLGLGFKHVYLVVQ